MQCKNVYLEPLLGSTHFRVPSLDAHTGTKAWTSRSIGASVQDKKLQSNSPILRSKYPHIHISTLRTFNPPSRSISTHDVTASRRMTGAKYGDSWLPWAAKKGPIQRTKWTKTREARFRNLGPERNSVFWVFWWFSIAFHFISSAAGHMHCLGHVGQQHLLELLYSKFCIAVLYLVKHRNTQKNLRMEHLGQGKRIIAQDEGGFCCSSWEAWKTTRQEDDHDDYDEGRWWWPRRWRPQPPESQ